MKFFDKFDEYIEKLLCVQFDASEMINHNLTKGEVREEFLKDQVKEQYESVHYHKGVIVDNKGFQSGQIDIIVTDKDTRVRRFGDQAIIDINDVKMILEIKSCAKKNDFDEFEEKAKIIKAHENGSDIQFGLFCYKYDVKTNTMLRRFGYRFDKELESYQYDDKIDVKYENIDFVLSIYKDEEEFNDDFYLAKDVTEKRFILFQNEPVSKYFFMKFSSL